MADAVAGQVLLGRSRAAAASESQADEAIKGASGAPVGKVLITGVSGYLGSWCAHKALEAGYEVVGTVRDVHSRKCAFLRDAALGRGGRMHPAAAERLRLVEADLLSGQEAWDKVLADGFDFVIHTASPFFFKEPKDPADYIRPAVEGTTSVLQAAMKSGVRRTVVTSSTVAVTQSAENGRVYTAEDWSDVDKIGSYARSKVMAERAAWQLAQGSGMEFVVINPAWVLGPTLYSDAGMLSGFESGVTMSRMVAGKMPLQPNICVPVCNVQDAAVAHIAALRVPEAAGRRFPICTGTVFLPEIIEAISLCHPELGLKARKIPGGIIRVASVVRPGLRDLRRQLNKRFSIDASGATTILGIEFAGLEATVKDMVDDFLALQGKMPPRA